MGSEWNLNRQSFVDFFTFGNKVIHSIRENLAQFNMRFTTMWYVRPAKAQTSLRIRAV